MIPYVYNATVKRIIDGDTIVVDIDLGFDMYLHDQYIRLDGIDTPEIRTRDLIEKQKGIAAKSFVYTKISNGSKILLQSSVYNDAKDKYGRILGIIWYESKGEYINLNEELINTGFAEKYE